MTWSYLPHTPEDRRQMLEAIGVKTVDELFGDVPAALRLDRALNLPPAMAEPDLVRHLQDLAGTNLNFDQCSCFLGAGVYDHYIPSVVDHVIRRSEFYTAYTQYQPEISQGYLQALWEYQSMICTLTGMDVANASMYDGGTAMAEAAMMACGATGRSRLLVARSVHPHYRTILGTYGRDRDYTMEAVGQADGRLDLSDLDSRLDNSVAAVIVQNPNFFGCVEDLAEIAARVHAQGGLLIVSADPISLGLLASPGSCGADIVTGEGQGLGLAASFGGPYLGFFAATEKLMRKMPGRIIGQTTDQEGTRGFVLTLQAREQHIRREKATSNICSNEALCALTAAVYLSAVGREGLGQVARLCLQKAAYAKKQLLEQAGCQAVFGAPHFKEFVVTCPRPVAEINAALLQKNILGGLDLSGCYPELGQAMLVCVTEKRTRAEIDRLAAEMGAMK
ncbi:MAG TPA: aminomethyl-transferring glycine dehydrogenase subunit GcvPA [Patescibacteria group bacterium]|nr:aminomethyl-transferring glycine dehydrogenase subunit GcvPA [Patescibacteria group bacterium]